MKHSLELTYQSSKKWIVCVMNDFDTFLQDHADCERKASAMAMSFIAKCPDRTDIIPKLIETKITVRIYILLKSAHRKVPRKIPNIIISPPIVGVPDFFII